jgi:hypothetical protein
LKNDVWIQLLIAINYLTSTNAMLKSCFPSVTLAKHLPMIQVLEFFFKLHFFFKMKKILFKNKFPLKSKEEIIEDRVMALP